MGSLYTLTNASASPGQYIPACRSQAGVGDVTARLEQSTEWPRMLRRDQRRGGGRQDASGGRTADVGGTAGHSLRQRTLLFCARRPGLYAYRRIVALGDDAPAPGRAGSGLAGGGGAPAAGS